MSMSEAGELSREELIERVVELETVLSEFQESSKELEQLLEEELQDLERANTTLQSTLDKTNEQLLKSNSRIVELTRELNESQEKAAEKAREQEHRLSEIQQQLVTVEISNDSMESNDRILTNKLAFPVIGHVHFSVVPLLHSYCNIFFFRNHLMAKYLRLLSNFSK